ncbi:MAG TPA: hypothetical protein VGE97_02465 [Nitrososphaera sp.]
MGLVKQEMKLKDRPRGVLDRNYVGYFPLWQKAALVNLVSDINRYHDVTLIEELMNVLEHNDDSQAMYYGGARIKPVYVDKNEDVLTLLGLARCCDMIRGTNSPWIYTAVGNTTTTTDASPSDTALDAEILTVTRVNMSDDKVGWREQTGMKIFYGAIYGEEKSASPIKEVAICQNSSGGTILNHTRFANAQLARTFKKTLGIVATVIEFCPMVV